MIVSAGSAELARAYSSFSGRVLSATAIVFNATAIVEWARANWVCSYMAVGKQLCVHSSRRASRSSKCVSMCTSGRRCSASA